MKSIAIGVHLLRDDVEPVADAVPVGDLFMSGIAIADDQPLSDRDLLLRAASVRASLLERATFVAVRYGFAFRTSGEALEKCASRLPRWKELLEEHRARVEFTLKVAAPAAQRPDRRDFESGAAYLRALHDARDAASVPEAFRREVERLVIPLAVSHRWVNRDSTSIELAGLIDRDALPRLGEAGQALKQTVPGVPFLLSAPWPLEVFAGVSS
ncbi:MAG TPA: GvpL/GvpF family gas vesicle protein [Thermoanaerobaculia bacterium]|nr:GvpL/GvpF family gas vesicle protein [Thermoanaerobaculia bacterium]